jgi:hypothetical protein
MIIAMVAVRMAQATLNDVVDMIPMRHRFMTASGTVHMAVLLASGEPMRLPSLIAAPTPTQTSAMPIRYQTKRQSQRRNHA